MTTVNKRITNQSTGLTMVWFIGACSCWYHGVGFWMGLFWPWYIGAVFEGLK